MENNLSIRLNNSLKKFKLSLENALKLRVHELKTIGFSNNDILELLNKRKEIVGYRLNSNIDRLMVDGILRNAMPIWNTDDKSVYFIRGHVGGSLVAKMKELQVLDIWFTPIYKADEVKSDWIKQNHLNYYYEQGWMALIVMFVEENQILI